MLYFLSYFSHFITFACFIQPTGNFVFCGLKCLSRHVDALPSTRTHQSQRDKPQGIYHTCPTKANQSPPTRSIEGCHFQRVSGIDPSIISSSPFCFKMIISTILIPLFASAVFCSDVIELGDSDFNDGVKGEEIMLVEFFAPWYVETQSCFRLVSLNST